MVVNANIANPDMKKFIHTARDLSVDQVIFFLLNKMLQLNKIF